MNSYEYHADFIQYTIFRSSVNKLWLLFCQFTTFFFLLFWVINVCMHTLIWFRLTLPGVFFFSSFYYSCCCCCCHVVIARIQMKSKAAGIEPNTMVYYYHIAYNGDSVSPEICVNCNKRELSILLLWICSSFDR